MKLSKTVKITLLVSLLLAVAAGLFLYLKKKAVPVVNALPSDTTTTPVVSSVANGATTNSVVPPVLTTNSPVSSSPVSSVVPPVLSTGSLPTARRVYASAGNMAGFAEKSGLSMQESLEFFTYDANINNRNFIDASYPQWWVDHFDANFPARYANFKKLTDAQYNALFTS